MIVYIRISPFTRSWLDLNHARYGRATFAQLVHGEYIDARPQWLRDAHVWSVDERMIQTSISVTKEQLTAVIDLALVHELRIPHSTASLVGQLLDAVARGYLKLASEVARNTNEAVE